MEEKKTNVMKQARKEEDHDQSAQFDDLVGIRKQSGPWGCHEKPLTPTNGATTTGWSRE